MYYLKWRLLFFRPLLPQQNLASSPDFSHGALRRMRMSEETEDVQFLDLEPCFTDSSSVPQQDGVDMEPEECDDEGTSNSNGRSR